MYFENVKTVHDVLIEVMNISSNIDSAALSLATSDYCPAVYSNGCGDVCSCVVCWKHCLESEVTTNDHA